MTEGEGEVYKWRTTGNECGSWVPNRWVKVGMESCNSAQETRVE